MSIKNIVYQTLYYIAMIGISGAVWGGIGFGIFKAFATGKKLIGILSICAILSNYLFYTCYLFRRRRRRRNLLNLDDKQGGFLKSLWRKNRQGSLEINESEENIEELPQVPTDIVLDDINLDISISEQDVRNILIIGKGSSGKSALANVISGTDKFVESASSVSETQDNQVEEFENGGIKYRIVEMLAIDDVHSNKEELLCKMAEAVYSVKDGLNQIIFVSNGRFSKGEIIIYNLLSTIFGRDFSGYTTIVRTHFPNFESKKECEEDIRSMMAENEELANIINACNKVAHVDNYPKSATNPFMNIHSKESREKTRTALLNHLANCQEVHGSNNLRELVKKVTKQLSDKEKLIQKKISLEIQLQKISQELAEGEAKDKDGHDLSEMTKSINREKEKIQGRIIELTKDISRRTSQLMEEKEVWVKLMNFSNASANMEVIPKCIIA